MNEYQLNTMGKIQLFAFRNLHSMLILRLLTMYKLGISFPINRFIIQAKFYSKIEQQFIFKKNHANLTFSKKKLKFRLFRNFIEKIPLVTFSNYFRLDYRQ